MSRPFQVLFTGRTVKDVSIRDVPREVLPNMQTCDRMSRSYPVYVSCIVIMFGRYKTRDGKIIAYAAPSECCKVIPDQGQMDALTVYRFYKILLNIYDI